MFAPRWTEQDEANVSDVGHPVVSPDATSPLSLLRSHRNSSMMRFSTGYMGYDGSSSPATQTFSIPGML
eukprot:3428207-Amphidinium_carterae.1